MDNALLNGVHFHRETNSKLIQDIQIRGHVLTDGDDMITIPGRERTTIPDGET